MPHASRLMPHSSHAAPRRIVVKLGTGVIASAIGQIDTARIAAISAQLATLRTAGTEVIVVSSGAVGLGMGRLGLAKKPKEVTKKQACAAVGQSLLMQVWQDAFRPHGLTVAQVLLTHEDLRGRDRYLSVKATLKQLVAYGTIPIINENDTVATDEIRFGDNDTLGALVTNLVEADALIILTDQSGLYSADPRKVPDATLIRDAVAGDPQLEAMAGGAGSDIGLGGMLTKVIAAKRAARSGAHTVIASGHEDNILLRLAGGEHVGTLLRAATPPLAARQQWMADHLQVRGRLTLDAGAVAALREMRRSLLPIGVSAVNGEFERGEVVGCCDEGGREIARGLVNYSASEARRIVRTPSAEIEQKLGYIDEPELIHRDNLVLL